jgi:hypothetical protein
LLIISHEVLQKLRGGFNGNGVVRIIDSHDDLYRLLPNGDIYVHWCQEGQERYTENGAYIGTLLKDCNHQPPQLNDNLLSTISRS